MVVVTCWVKRQYINDGGVRSVFVYRPGWWLWRWITVHIFWGTLMTLALLYFELFFLFIMFTFCSRYRKTYSLLKGLILMMHRLATVDLKSHEHSVWHVCVLHIESRVQLIWSHVHKTPMLLMID